RNRHFAHQRLGGLREGGLLACARCLAVAAAAARVPSGDAAAGIAARLDRAPARRVVAQHGSGLRLLRLLVGLGFSHRRLRRMQGGGRSGSRGCFGGLLLLRGLLLGFLALALLLFLELGRLKLRELLLAARLFFS